MARKEPFKRVSVSVRIYGAVDKKRREEFSEEFRPLPMNTYCEKILWDYARGALIPLVGTTGSDRQPQMVAEIAGESLELPDELAESTRKASPKSKRAGKKTRSGS